MKKAKFKLLREEKFMHLLKKGALYKVYEHIPDHNQTIEHSLFICLNPEKGISYLCNHYNPNLNGEITADYNRGLRFVSTIEEV